MKRASLAVLLSAGVLGVVAAWLPTAMAGPVTVQNPWLVNDRVADTHNLAAMAATYVKAYTPDGVIPPASDEDKAINIYNNQKRRLYHWADEPPSVGGNINDPTYNQNVFGWSLCGRHAGQACTIVKAAGLGNRQIALPGHWIYEVRYSDGTWHAYDTMTTMYIFNKAVPPRVASCGEMKADPSLLADAVVDGRACPGFLLCGDTAAWYQSAVGSWSDYGDTAVTPTWTGAMNLRSGQSFLRTWESWLGQHPTAMTGQPPNPPYHHEARRDNQDYVNFPYWEPYALTSAQSAAIDISYTPTYRRWANGTDTIAPDFRSDAYQALLEPASHDIATFFSDGLTPDLHPATVGTLGEAVFKIDLPYYLTDAVFSGDFVKTNSGDVCNVLFSTTGTTWTQVWTAPGLGTTAVTNQSLRTHIFGKWKTWYIKLQFKATAAKSDVGVSNFVVVTTFEHNKGAMAYLDKGVNHITLTFDNPAALQASGRVLRVLYKWKEYGGSDWTVDKKYEIFTTASPTTFTINTMGTKVPRTEHILMEVVAPPSDAVAPAAVTDLTAGMATPSRVPLTWTATGDDGLLGQANAYDLRYSTDPITDDASFAAAVPAAGVPSPRVPGQTETFSVAGLQAGITYHFALKVIDEVGNASALSNVATVQTPPADTVPPETILNLAGMANATPGRVDLTWTAPADFGYGGTGPYTCTSYDLRYSTSPITEAGWAAATAVTNLALPKAPGAAEALQVANLATRTTYYFAIRSVDESGNLSAISNVVMVRTGGTLTVLTIADVGLYGAGSDYSNRGSGGRLDVGPTQSGLLTFDLAGKIAPGEMVTSATLQLYSARGGYSFNLQTVGYPLAAPWQEGIGNAGAVGDTGFPWGPASIGDAVFAYKQTTAVGLGTGGFASTMVATAGVPWNTPGGRGIGSDVLNRPMFNLNWTRTISGSDPIGVAMPVIPLSAEGTAVVRGWSSGALANNGLNMWAASGSGYAALTTREFNGNRPQLVLTIGICGDVTGDGHVNAADLAPLSATWAKSSGNAGYDPNCDLNGDGAVNVVDVLTLAANWGT